MLDELNYEGVIGQGAFALVSKYTDENGNVYAVKKLKKESKSNKSDVKRFKREIAILEVLKDEPNIIPLLTYDEKELLYVMPYAEQNLYKYITLNNQLLSTEERVVIFEHIIDGISVAHSKNILHRDITPNNVLKIDGEWFVCDFGLGKDYSRFTQGGYSSVQGYGSYHYAAPEQVDKLKDASIQSDIYSLGKIFYFILTGREPRDINDAPVYKSLIKNAASERVEDRYENVSVLKKELLKHKKLYAKLNTTTIQNMTVREYLTNQNKINWDEFYEIAMNQRVNDHIYYDFIEPITNYLDSISIIEQFTQAIGIGKTIDFITLFINKLHECYATTGWPFSSLNSFGYFLNRFYLAIPNSPQCQLACLKELWELAAYHDQWAIQDLITNILNKNEILGEIEEDFAFHMLELNRSFVKMNKLNTGQIQSTYIVRAIQSLREN